MKTCTADDALHENLYPLTAGARVFHVRLVPGLGDIHPHRGVNALHRCAALGIADTEFDVDVLAFLDLADALVGNHLELDRDAVAHQFLHRRIRRFPERRFDRGRVC